MTLPDWLYIGVPKAGSTWIFEYLRTHPDVYVPEAKDLYYFSRFYDRGIDWYEEQFTEATSNQLVGELSTSYAARDDAMSRIARDLPGAKLLWSIRNPIARTWSAYRYLKKHGEISGGLMECLEIDPPIFLGPAGRYETHMERIRSLGLEQNLVVLSYDDLALRPAKFADDLENGLGIAPNPKRDELLNEVVNPASGPRNVRLVALAKRVADRARIAGWESQLGVLKSNPALRALLYQNASDAGGRAEIPAAELEFLQDYHRSDIKVAGEVLEQATDHWLDGSL